MYKYILIVFIALGCQISNAQGLQLFQLADSLPAASNYTFTIGAGDPTLVYEFIVKNTSGAAISNKVKKTVLGSQMGQDIYFCYQSVCYTPATLASQTVSLGAGQQFPNGGGAYGLRTEFDNNSVVGAASVLYRIYDVNNTTDEVLVTINYNVIATGIESFTNNVSVSNAYPNPVADILKISYNLNATAINASVKIYNALGSLVKSIPVNSTKSISQIDVTDLEEGFYFYNLVANGKSSATRKFVVSR